jgi:hypothetical protein
MLDPVFTYEQYYQTEGHIGELAMFRMEVAAAQLLRLRGHS